MTDRGVSKVCGIVLAAGSGTRYGGPKALAHTADGRSWTRVAVETLGSAGCGDVLVAIGADADTVMRLVPPPARPVRIEDWATGLSASLRGALAAAAGTRAHAALVIPVDTPALPPAVCARLLDAVPPDLRSLARAVFDGRPGHPVLIGRAHWDPISATLNGDMGAAGYLRAHGARRVECGDLWDGADIDVA